MNAGVGGVGPPALGVCDVVYYGLYGLIDAVRKPILIHCPYVAGKPGMLHACRAGMGHTKSNIVL